MCGGGVLLRQLRVLRDDGGGLPRFRWRPEWGRVLALAMRGADGRVLHRQLHVHRQLAGGVRFGERCMARAGRGVHSPAMLPS
jgi:hypothetical protein